MLFIDFCYQKLCILHRGHLPMKMVKTTYDIQLLQLLNAEMIFTRFILTIFPNVLCNFVQHLLFCILFRYGKPFSSKDDPKVLARTHRLCPDIEVIASLIARFMGPTWGPSGADRIQVGPMLALWNFLTGMENVYNLLQYVNSVDQHKHLHFKGQRSQLPGSKNSRRCTWKCSGPDGFR